MKKEKGFEKPKSKRGRKPTGKKKEQSCNQFLDMQAWIEMYNKSGRLPCNKIICSVCHKNYTSMFGDNLKRTVKKFGSIVILLDSFECKDCRKASKPIKPVKPSKKTKELSEEEKLKTPKKILTPEEIEDRKEYIRSTLPRFDPDARPIRCDLNDPLVIKDLTTGMCQRPDIYLDAGCKYCSFVKHCACGIRDVSRDLIKEKERTRARNNKKSK